jgi:hypothetical protein
LAEQKYIEWNRENPEKIKLLEAWERKSGIFGRDFK